MENMQNMEEGRSRKKLLVPLVVLMLCAVSLVGAAYAYNSTLTNSDNDATIHYLSVGKQESGDLVVPGTDAILDFDDNFHYNTNTLIKNIITCELKAGDIVVATYKFNIKSDVTENVKFSVSSDDLANKYLFGDSNVNKIVNYFDIKYKIGTGDAHDVKIGDATADTVEVSTNTNIDVNIVFTLKEAYSATPGTTNVLEVEDTSTTHTSNTAKTYYDAFGNNSGFSMSFKAESINSTPATP